MPWGRAKMRDPRDDSNGVFYKNLSHGGDDPFTTDIEMQSVGDDSTLKNNTVKSFLWKDITVTVPDRKTKQPKAILDGVDGIVEAGTPQFLRIF